MSLIIESYNIAGIGREEPTDFPPKNKKEYPTDITDLELAVVAYLTSEDEDDVWETVSSMELGADGALYHQDEDLIRYLLN